MLREFIMLPLVIFFIAIVVAIFCGACGYMNSMFGLSDDNFIEELIESQIEHHLGIDVDLTPDSPEEAICPSPQ